MSVQMRLKKVAVEKLLKDGALKNTLLHIPDSEQNSGLVVFAAESTNLKAGQKVYFGNKREQVRINGKDLLIMDDDNIFAVISEEN